MHGKLQQIGLRLSIRSDFKTVTFLHHSRVGAIKLVTLSGLSVCVCVCVCLGWGGRIFKHRQAPSGLQALGLAWK